MSVSGRVLVLALILLVCLVPLSAGYENPVSANAKVASLKGPEYVELTRPGALVIIGGGSTPQDAMNWFYKQAKKGTNHLVVIPTASAEAGKAPDAEWIKSHEKEVGKVTLLHPKTPEQAKNPEFAQPIREASAVWISGGDQKRLADAFVGTPIQTELKELLKRGGVIGGTSAGAAIVSETMIAGGNPEPIISTGLGLLPRIVVDQHFSERKRQPRLDKAIHLHPTLVGLGLDEGTAAIIEGRNIRFVGKGQAHLRWKGSEKELSQKAYKLGDYDDLVRIFRLPLGTLAAKPRGKPLMEKGHVMAVGGGGMGRDLHKRFIELAGGPDALIVVLPTANEGNRFLEGKQTESPFVRAGAKRVKSLTGITQAEVESPEFLKALSEAGGVWFGGGRQWRFVDAYENTKAFEAMRGVLARGGVIGGSSAGATILGDYLCRGNPLGNLEIMMPGYEQGFAFLPGVGIDQHFTQRKRFKEMESFVNSKPWYVGIGIDEATALIVGPEKFEVMGPGKVHVYPTGGKKKEFAQGDKIDKDWCQAEKE